MRFAITLLVVIAIASAIGTVLRQNEPFNAYINEFGPFWFEVFRSLDLHAVYNAWWFLLILAFLVVSTGTCLVRHTPQMLRDMRSFREHAREASLRQFAQQAEWPSGLQADAVLASARERLSAAGFRFRESPQDGTTLIAGKRGSWNRWGYVLAHSAIVLICIGGLVDGNVPLKLAMLIGDKQPTRYGQLLDTIPAPSRLGPDNPSFRGNVFLPEGSRSNAAMLNYEDGMLLQELPFSLVLKRFTIDHYANGMPKRFVSDLIVVWPDGRQKEASIEVNKPLVVDGITLYQASFEDGGSRVDWRLRSLGPFVSSKTGSGRIGESAALSAGGQDFQVEYTGFKAINVENLDEAAEAPRSAFASLTDSAVSRRVDQAMQNVGPSFQYKLRDSAGQAREFLAYHLPVVRGGLPVALIGMRESPGEPFRFLRIPVDDGTTDAWYAFRATLMDPAKRPAIVKAFVAAASSEETSNALRQQLAISADQALKLFAERGYARLGEFIEKNIPEKDRDKAAEIFVRLLQGMAWEAWKLNRQNVTSSVPQDPARIAWLTTAMTSVSDAFHLGTPVVLEPTGFEEVRASVIQLTRSPGKPLVYLGSLLLVLGIFIMFYIHDQRLFLLVKPGADGCQVLFAMTAVRRTLDFESTFNRLTNELATATGSLIEINEPTPADCDTTAP